MERSRVSRLQVAAPSFNQSAGMSHARTVVLFIGEGVTLAHVGRPIALANGLDPTRFEVNFACDERHRLWLADSPWPYKPLRSIGSDRFLRAVAKGGPLFDAKTLESYVAADLELIAQVRPDVIVGDFRLSLSISARLAKVPYVAISNAYWSPYARLRFPVPEHWTTRRFGLWPATAVFGLARPLFFAKFCAPFNAVRRKFGMTSLGSDIRRMNTDADRVVYADIPDMIPTTDLPESHRYIGPVLWSPTVALPAWWPAASNARDAIYVTLGSSGNERLMPMIVDAVAGLQRPVFLATAGHGVPPHLPANVYAADFLPGDVVVQRAQVVICNGGSPTSHQSLAAGVPVLGIASNMDQLLNMQAVVDYGAGLCLRADKVSRRSLRRMLTTLLSSEQYRAAALKASEAFASYPTADLLMNVLDDTFPEKRAPRRQVLQAQ